MGLTKKKSLEHRKTNVHNTLKQNFYKLHKNNYKNIVAKSKIKNKIKNRFKKENNLNNLNNKKQTKKNKKLLSFVGGGPNDKYTNESGDQMKTVKTMSFLEKKLLPDSFTDLRTWYSGKTLKFFIKSHPQEWAEIISMNFLSKKRKYFLKNLESMGETIFLINYVFYKQQKVRKIIFKLERYLTERTKIIFNSNVSEDELLEGKGYLARRKIPQYFGKENTNQKGGVFINKIPDHPALYNPAALIVGPTDNDFDKIKYEEKYTWLEALITKKPMNLIAKLYKKFRSKLHTKGKFKRYELDRLYDKIVKYKKMLFKHILPLLKGQRKLYISYHKTRQINDEDIFDRFKSSFLEGAEKVKRIKSLGIQLQKKLESINKRKKIFDVLKNQWIAIDGDYGRIVKMYDTSIKGFWLQDEYGRVVSRFYAKQDYKFGRAFIDLIKNIEPSVYIDQIGFNILGELYKTLSKNIVLRTDDNKKASYLEIRMVAHVKKCYSRILTQAYVWAFLSRTQGFNFMIEGIMNDPTKKYTEINFAKEETRDTSLIDKMILTDKLLTYYKYGQTDNDPRNFVGWKKSPEGLHAFMSFCSLVGIYDNDIEKLGIEPHQLLTEYKEKIETEFKEKVAKKVKDTSETPKKNQTGGGFNKIKLSRNATLFYDGQSYRMGWFDVWRRHFEENFYIFTNLVKAQDSKEKSNLTIATTPDVYYNYYRNEIHLIVVEAFSSCGMLDLIFRSFIRYMEFKIDKEKLSDVIKHKFNNKLNYICDYSQLIYSFLMVFDRNVKESLTDETFKKKIPIMQDIVKFLFSLYDNPQSLRSPPSPPSPPPSPPSPSSSPPPSPPPSPPSSLHKKLKTPVKAPPPQLRTPALSRADSNNLLKKDGLNLSKLQRPKLVQSPQLVPQLASLPKLAPSPQSAPQVKAPQVKAPQLVPSPKLASPQSAPPNLSLLTNSELENYVKKLKSLQNGGAIPQIDNLYEQEYIVLKFIEKKLLEHNVLFLDEYSQIIQIAYKILDKLNSEDDDYDVNDPETSLSQNKILIDIMSKKTIAKNESDSSPEKTKISITPFQLTSDKDVSQFLPINPFPIDKEKDIDKSLYTIRWFNHLLNAFIYPLLTNIFFTTNIEDDENQRYLTYINPIKKYLYHNNLPITQITQPQQLKISEYIPIHLNINLPQKYYFLNTNAHKEWVNIQSLLLSHYFYSGSLENLIKKTLTLLEQKRPSTSEEIEERSILSFDNLYGNVDVAIQEVIDENESYSIEGCSQRLIHYLFDLLPISSNSTTQVGGSPVKEIIELSNARNKINQQDKLSRIQKFVLLDFDLTITKNHSNGDPISKDPMPLENKISFLRNLNEWIKKNCKIAIITRCIDTEIIKYFNEELLIDTENNQRTYTNKISIYAPTADEFKEHYDTKLNLEYWANKKVEYINSFIELIPHPYKNENTIYFLDDTLINIKTVKEKIPEELKAEKVDEGNYEQTFDKVNIFLKKAENAEKAQQSRYPVQSGQPGQSHRYPGPPGPPFGYPGQPGQPPRYPVQSGQSGGYPVQPLGYQGQPHGYPEQPLGYPGQPRGYQGLPFGYPGQPGQPAQPLGYPEQLGQPPRYPGPPAQPFGIQGQSREYPELPHPIPESGSPPPHPIPESGSPLPHHRPESGSPPPHPRPELGSPPPPEHEPSNLEIENGQNKRLHNLFDNNKIIKNPIQFLDVLLFSNHIGFFQQIQDFKYEDLSDPNIFPKENIKLGDLILSKNNFSLKWKEIERKNYIQQIGGINIKQDIRKTQKRILYENDSNNIKNHKVKPIKTITKNKTKRLKVNKQIEKEIKYKLTGGLRSNLSLFNNNTNYYTYTFKALKDSKLENDFPTFQRFISQNSNSQIEVHYFGQNERNDKSSGKMSLSILPTFKFYESENIDSAIELIDPNFKSSKTLKKIGLGINNYTREMENLFFKPLNSPFIGYGQNMREKLKSFIDNNNAYIKKLKELSKYSLIETNNNSFKNFDYHFPNNDIINNLPKPFQYDNNNIQNVIVLKFKRNIICDLEQIIFFLNTFQLWNDKNNGYFTNLIQFIGKTEIFSKNDKKTISRLISKFIKLATKIINNSNNNNNSIFEITGKEFKIYGRNINLLFFDKHNNIDYNKLIKYLAEVFKLYSIIFEAVKILNDIKDTISRHSTHNNSDIDKFLIDLNNLNKIYGIIYRNNFNDLWYIIMGIDTIMNVPYFDRQNNIKQDNKNLMKVIKIMYYILYKPHNESTRTQPLNLITGNSATANELPKKRILARKSTTSSLHSFSSTSSILSTSSHLLSSTIISIENISSSFFQRLIQKILGLFKGNPNPNPNYENSKKKISELTEVYNEADEEQKKLILRLKGERDKLSIDKSKLQIRLLQSLQKNIDDTISLSQLKLISFELNQRVLNRDIIINDLIRDYREYIKYLKSQFEFQINLFGETIDDLNEENKQEQLRIHNTYLTWMRNNEKEKLSIDNTTNNDDLLAKLEKLLNQLKTQLSQVNDSFKKMETMRDQAQRERNKAMENKRRFQNKFINAAKERDEALAERDKALAEKDQAQRERDKALAERNQALVERDKVQIERNQALAEKDQALAEKEAALAEKEVALAEKDAALAEKDAALVDKEAALAEKDQAQIERNQALEDRKAALADRDAALKDREATMTEILNLRRQLSDLTASSNIEKVKMREEIDKLIDLNKNLIKENNKLNDTNKYLLTQIDILTQQIQLQKEQHQQEIQENEERYHRELGILQNKLAELQQQLDARQRQLAKKDRELAEKDEELAETQGELAETQGELAKKDRELAETQGELAETQGELAEKDRKLLKTRGQLAETQGQLAQTQMQLEEISENLRRQKILFDDEKKQLEEEKEELLRQNALFEQENTELSADNKRLIRKNIVLCLRINQLKQSTIDIQQLKMLHARELADLKREHILLTQQIQNKHAAEIQQKNREHQGELAKNLEDFNKQIYQLREEYEKRLQEQSDIFNSEKEQILADHIDRKNFLEEEFNRLLRQHIAENEEQLNLLRAEIDRQQPTRENGQVSRLQGKNAELMQRIETLEEKNRQIHQTLEESNRKKNSLSQTIEKLRKQLEEQNTQFRQNINERNMELGTRNQNQQKYKRQIKLLTQQLNDFREQLQYLEGEKTEALRLNEIKTTTLQLVQAQTAKIYEGLAQISRRILSSDKKIQDLIIINARLRYLLHERDTTNPEIEEIIGRLQQEMVDQEMKAVKLDESSRVMFRDLMGRSTEAELMNHAVYQTGQFGPEGAAEMIVSEASRVAQVAVNNEQLGGGSIIFEAETIETYKTSLKTSLSATSNILKDIQNEFLEFSTVFNKLFTENEENQTKTFKETKYAPFFTKFNEKFPDFNKIDDQTQTDFSSFYNMNMRFYSHIIREWTTANYSHSKYDICYNVIKNLLRKNHFDNKTLSQIMENEKIDKQFMRLQLYDNGTFQLDQHYLDQIDNNLNKYKNEIKKIKDFLIDPKKLQLLELIPKEKLKFSNTTEVKNHRESNHPTNNNYLGNPTSKLHSSKIGNGYWEKDFWRSGNWPH